jgi:hypothetical protein
VTVKNSYRLFVFSILAAAWCAPARASVTEYTDQTSFLSATSNITTIGFEGIASSNQDVYFNNSGGETIDGVNFAGLDSGNNYTLYVENETPNWGSGSYLVGPEEFSANVSAIEVSLPSGVYAVAANIMAGGGGVSDAVTEEIQLSTGSTMYPVTTISGFSSMAFVGFVSDTPITSMSFFSESPSDHVVIDNFQFGQAVVSDPSPTPETSTSLLCGSGLLLLVQILRRRMGLPGSRS